ncbi:hypothetical protein [Orenia marismortui]|uniref:hypothetical protein n=1 Tax=Orenia marismortui TaxID=46469 RepID=UPI000375FB30|nr:hypothetical protein [Orenia marismortui]
MKKLIILFIFVTLLFISQNTFAKNFEVIGKLTYNTFDLIKYSKGKEISIYNDKETEESFRDQAEKGSGYYLGLIYWFNEKWGVEGGFDLAESTYDGTCPKETANTLAFDVDREITTQKLYGPYFGLAYSINEIFRLKAGILRYYLKQDDTFKNNGQTMLSSTIAECKGKGALLGGEVNYPIKENILLTADFNYRIAKVSLSKVAHFIVDESGKMVDVGELEDYDEDHPLYAVGGKQESEMNGFRLGISLSYLF